MSVSQHEVKQADSVIGVREKKVAVRVSQELRVRHCGGPSPVHGSCGCVPFASPAGVSIWPRAPERACGREGSQPSAAAAAVGVFGLDAPGELSASCAFSPFSIPARRTRPRCSELGD